MSGMTLDRLESIVTDGASSDEEVSKVVEFIAVLRKRLQEAENVLSFSKQYENSQQWTIEQQALQIENLENKLVTLSRTESWQEY